MSSPISSRRPAALGLGLVGGIVALALVETAAAWVAPSRAPTDDDWRAVEAEVRAGFRPGDLIVAAPFWSDQVMRLHLGDLTPPAVAGRMDDARFGRVWEISQRGAHAPEASSGRAVSTSRHGALALRLIERKAATVTFDAVESFTERPGARRRIVEVDGRLRRAVLAPPDGTTPKAVEFTEAPLGHELAFACGLHDVWRRKVGKGVAVVRALIDGRDVGRCEASNESGWRVVRADTAAWAGKRAVLRFEITSDEPFARELSFAAEARDP